MFAMLFSGQGSQYPGMVKDIYQKHNEVKRLFEEAGDVLHRDCASLCFDSTEKKLADTAVTGLAVFLAGYARYYVWSEVYGLPPDIVAGHSIGELTALAVSGVFSFRDALTIVNRRCQMQCERATEKPGGMIAVRGLCENQIEDCLCGVGGPLAYLSCYNAPQQFSVAGPDENMERVRHLLEEKGGRAIVLKTGGAFHTPLMHPADEELFQFVNQFEMGVPSIPVISSTTGAPHLFTWNVAQVLGRQMVEPVRWSRAMQVLKEYPIQLIADMGPKSVVGRLALQNGIDTKIITAENVTEPEQDKLRVSRKRSLTAASEKSSLFRTDREFLDFCILHSIAVKNECVNEMLYEENVKKPLEYLSWLLNETEEAPLSRDEVLYLLNMVKKILQIKAPSLGSELFERLLSTVGVSSMEAEIDSAQPLKRAGNSR